MSNAQDAEQRLRSRPALAQVATVNPASRSGPTRASTAAYARTVARVARVHRAWSRGSLVRKGWREHEVPPRREREFDSNSSFHWVFTDHTRCSAIRGLRVTHDGCTDPTVQHSRLLVASRLDAFLEYLVLLNPARK
jgi:hypothetical protein